MAIGTHDLSTLTPPFSYEALPPRDIAFVPLKKTEEFTAEELMTVYQSDNKLKKFLPIIQGSFKKERKKKGGGGNVWRQAILF